jgi:hypothetical protein
MDEQGRVVSDFEHVDLTAQELELLRDVLGRKAGEVLAHTSTGERLEVLQELFSKGVLTLRTS